MPDVKVRIPRKLFHNVDKSRRKEVRRGFKVVVAECTARFLSCVDYELNPVILKQTDIDVHVTSYKRSEVYMYGAPVIVEITGYDYPSRMARMDDILGDIRDCLTAFLAQRANYRPAGKMVSVCYIPIPKNCWA
jgi:hypothetical protein